MQAVAPVAEILYESQRKSLMTYQDIAFRSIRKHYRIPVKIGQSRLMVYLCTREGISIQRDGKGEICPRDEKLTLHGTYRTACRHHMKGTAKSRDISF